ncbi:MAG: ROK family protein [Acidobacteriota bacterium]|nr:ROK family protein [Acidobacteriota bacterium]
MAHTDPISNKHVIGVDVGGTKVAAGIVNHLGEIGELTRVPMVCEGSAAEGFSAVAEAIDYLFSVAKQRELTVRGIGICAPGPLDPNTGMVINPPNVKCWRDYPLAAEVSKRYQLPVKIENDANAAALAEVLWGKGNGYRHVFYFSVGTGIGTGLVLDGHIYNGRTGAATEGGHVSIDYRGPVCSCGKRGCIEAFIAGPAIAKRARAKLEARSNSESAMLNFAKGKIDNVTCEVVSRAYAAGDALAKETLLETVELLSVWLGNTIDLLEPDVIIIGGGVGPVLQTFISEIRARLPAWCINPRCHEIPLVPAHYGANAGIAGGAALCN